MTRYKTDNIYLKFFSECFLYFGIYAEIENNII